MGVLDNKNRIASISSSKAHLITANGIGKKPFSAGCITYLNQLKREKRFTLSVEDNFYSRPAAWGIFCERYVSENILGFKYKHLGDVTFTHPEINRWVGTPDFLSADCVSELKAYYPKKFTEYAEAIESQDLELIKKNFKQEYWQIVSNACILDLKFGETFLFMPKFENLDLISASVEDYEGSDLWKYRFIHEEILDRPENPAIPFIPKESDYKDWNEFRFEIPKEDKDLLTDKILLAIEYLES